MKKQLFLLGLLICQTCFAFIFPQRTSDPASSKSALTIEYLGYTSFLITDQSGLRVLTDPYLDGYGLPFPGFMSVDLVAISDAGVEHDAAHQLRGNPVILSAGGLAGSVGDFQIEGFAVGEEAGRAPGTQHNYIIRHGATKLVFLGKIDRRLPEATLEKLEGAEAVLVGAAPAPAFDQLVNRPNARTLVTLPAGSQASGQPSQDAPAVPKIEITENMPRQVVRLQPRASEMTKPGPDYSIFRGTVVEMTWPQVKQAAAESAIVLVPVGVVEEHGPHMGLGADTYLAYLHSRRIKEALGAAGIKAVIAPPFYWGITDDTSSFPGSFNVRPETMTALITDLCASLKSWGFRRLVFVNEHGNRNHRRVLRDSLAKIREQLEIETYSLDSMLTGVPVYQPAGRAGGYSPDYHAGAAETGVMVTEFPQEVDVRLAQRLTAQPNFAPLGYVGDPAAFSRETALSDYYLKAPESDAKRIVAFFSLEPSKRGETGAGRSGQTEIDEMAQQLIDRYILAAGGAERLQTVKSQKRVGQLVEHNRPAPLSGAWSGDQWSLTITRGPDFTERFGFNGTYGWHIERGDVGQLPEPLVMLVSRVVDPRLPLHLKAMIQNSGTPREEIYGDGPVLVMEAELKSGTKAVLTFDPKTGLLVKWNETAFEDYREVDGMLFPFVVKARPGTEARFERMENNTAVEAEQFEPPAS